MWPVGAGRSAGVSVVSLCAVDCIDNIVDCGIAVDNSCAVECTVVPYIAVVVAVVVRTDRDHEPHLLDGELSLLLRQVPLKGFHWKKKRLMKMLPLHLFSRFLLLLC